MNTQADIFYIFINRKNPNDKVITDGRLKLPTDNEWIYLKEANNALVIVNKTQVNEKIVRDTIKAQGFYRWEESRILRAG